MVGRRRILTLGAMGLAAAVAGACSVTGESGGSEQRPAAPRTTSRATTPTGAGTVPPVTPPGPDEGLDPRPPDPDAPTPGDVAASHAGRQPQQWGVDVSGVHRWLVDPGTPGAPTLALTFDACGGPGGSGVDQVLLDFLVAESIPATLFLNQRWILANRGLTEQLVASELFEVGNHGSRHLPLSVTGQAAYGIGGTRDARDAASEVWENHELLTGLMGEPPRWFRSGTAHYDEVATDIAVELGERPVGFTTNGDAGATAPASVVAAEVTAAPAGGIVLAHMNHPQSGTAAGVAQAIASLRDGGWRLVTLTGGGGTRA